MLFMMAEVSNSPVWPRLFQGTGSGVFSRIIRPTSNGPVVHCMTRSSRFSFLVGVALPYSIASRLAKGKTFGPMFGHALWRGLALVALGIFLRSLGSQQTYFTFEDTLTQIGLGYPFLFLLGFCRPRWQWTALAAILTGYWLAWALYPAPGPGFAAHWAKNANLGNAFDQWFLNLFLMNLPFVANGGGYLTLSFIPTLGTMILGPGRRPLVAVVRAADPDAAVAGSRGDRRHLRSPAACRRDLPDRETHLDAELDSVQRGFVLLFLAAFCWLTEVRGWRKWAFPLTVIGMNSMAAYLIAHLWERFILDSFRIHLGPGVFQLFGTGAEPLLRAWRCS